MSDWTNCRVAASGDPSVEVEREESLFRRSKNIQRLPKFVQAMPASAGVLPLWKGHLGSDREQSSRHTRPRLATGSRLRQPERPSVCFVCAVPSSRGKDGFPYRWSQCNCQASLPWIRMYACKIPNV